MQFIPQLIVPEPLLGILRGADRPSTHRDKWDRRDKIVALGIIRVAIAFFATYQIAKRLKADPDRISIPIGVLLSMPAAALYWGGKCMYQGVKKIQQGFKNRNFHQIGSGGALWVGGCVVIHLFQVPCHYKGYRWGLVELLFKDVTKDITYRGNQGY